MISQKGIIFFFLPLSSITAEERDFRWGRGFTLTSKTFFSHKLLTFFSTHIKQTSFPKASNISEAQLSRLWAKNLSEEYRFLPQYYNALSHLCCNAGSDFSDS